MPTAPATIDAHAEYIWWRLLSKPQRRGRRQVVNTASEPKVRHVQMPMDELAIEVYCAASRGETV